MGKINRKIFDEEYDEIYAEAQRVADDFWTYHSTQNAKMKKTGGEASYISPMVRRTTDYTIKIFWVKCFFTKKPCGGFQRRTTHIKKKKGNIYNMAVLLKAAPAWEHDSIRMAENEFAFLRARLHHLTRIGNHLRLYEEVMASKKVQAPEPAEF